MTSLRISIPVYKRNRWGNLDTSGEIVVSDSEARHLSDSYDSLKLQIDEFLLKLGAENQLVLDCQQLQDEIDTKKSVLRTLNSQIERANCQFNRLKNFLARLGIDATGGQMIVAQDVQETIRLVAVVDGDNDGDSGDSSCTAEF